MMALQKIHSDSNCSRFYNLSVQQGLFDDFALVREWGRIGRPGTVRHQWFDSEEVALKKMSIAIKEKQGNGYISIGDAR